MTTKGKTLMEVFAEEEKNQMDENGNKLVTAIRWGNIHRISEELEIAAEEVQSAYWIQQARRLRARAAFEMDNANGKRAVE